MGIGGNSGVGKTNLSEAISNIFSLSNSLVIRGDDMHKWQRGHEKWSEFTHLDPKANLLHQDIVMLNDLKSGKKVSRRIYDHESGTFTDTLVFLPRNITIFEGLHPFYLSRQRKLYDLKIFIKPDRELADHWKIVRDILKRGYSKDKIVQTLKLREDDSRNFIASQAQYADIIISPKPLHPILSIGSATETIEITYDLLIPNSVHLEHIIDDLNLIKDLTVSQDYLDDDKQRISVQGCISSNELSAIANNHILGLFDLRVDDPEWPCDAFGVIILLLTYSIFEVAEYGKD